MKLMKMITAMAVTFIAVQMAAPVKAECVRLNTGDVLIGDIVEHSDDVIVMEHPVLGRINLARAGITSIADAPEAAGQAEVAMAAADAAQAMEVKASSDTEPTAAEQAEAATQTAEAAAKTDAAPAEVAEAADEAAAPAEAVAEAAAEPAPAPAPVADVKPEDVAEPPPLEAEDPAWRKWLEEWKMKLALGFNFREHTRQTIDVNARFTGTYSDDADRWKVDLAYYRSSVDGRESRNEIRAFVQKDWLFPDSPWFMFGQGQYDYDQYKSWDHRVSLHGGLGYSLEEWLGVDVNLRAGGGVTREFGGVDPNTRPESIFGSELEWQVTERHHIAATIQIFPGVDEFREYRMVSTADWTVKLTEALGMRLGLRDEYDSAEPSGYKNNDMRLYGSLVFSF